MTDIIRYAEYSEEEFNREAERAGQIAGTQIMDIKQGENVVRFIPPKEPGVPVMRSTAMHYLEAVPGLDRIVVFACPKQEKVSPTCPACEAASRLSSSPNPIDRSLGERWAAKLTIYANVVDRAAPADDPTYGLRVLRFGKSILEQLKTIRRSQRTGGDFFNPGPQGFDLVITREGEQKATKYKVIPDRNNCPAFEDPAITQAVIDNAYDLNQYVNPVCPDEIIRALEASGSRTTASGSRGALPAAAPSAARPAPAQPLHNGDAQRVASQARAGAGLFDGTGAGARPVPSAGQTVAQAEFTDDEDDDFGPPRG